ncbi:MAG: metallophosphoesterase family protein [Candidatus Limnocylindria bacterium]
MITHPRIRLAIVAIGLFLLIIGIVASRGADRAASPLGSVSPSTDAAAVLVGAGDIATCNDSNDEATAALLDEIEGTVFTVGDNAYSDGSTDDYSECYAPSWGRHQSRTRPAPGNHDYHTANAEGYYEYFGTRAGGEGGYYAYDLGAWRIYSLNSEIVSDEQITWLTDDLDANPSQCVLAYWHHPLFSSGRHGNDKSVRPFWDALSAAGADVVVNGHDHDYERFAPQMPDGVASADGLREFVVGTGGARLRTFAKIRNNSEVRNAETFGVIELTLKPTGYDWQFIPASGGTFRDAGSASCH